MKVVKRIFYRLCQCNGKDYAVETIGEPVSMGIDDPIDYFITQSEVSNQWSISIVKNGMLVGHGYSKRKDALSALVDIDKQLRGIVEKNPNIINSFELDNAEQVSAENYKRIWKESHDVNV